MKTNQIQILLIVFSAVVLTAFSFHSLQEPWEVPSKYKKMENPTKATKEDMVIAKGLWEKHCKSCHGKMGLGDGTKAKELDTPVGNFSTATFHDQTDGELFYKTTFGRDDMPAYDKKIPSDNDRWLIVHYMRTMKK